MKTNSDECAVSEDDGREEDCGSPRSVMIAG